MSRSYIPENPVKKLTEEQVKPLCERQWTHIAIAAYLNVSVNTLHRQFGDKLMAWKRLGQANLLDRAWLRIQDKGYKNERLFIEMMKRYVWKTHMDSVRIERVMDPEQKNREEKLADLYNEIQLAVKTQKAWVNIQKQSLQSEQPLSDSPCPMGLLNQQSQDSNEILPITEEKLN